MSRLNFSEIDQSRNPYHYDIQRINQYYANEHPGKLNAMIERYNKAERQRAYNEPSALESKRGIHYWGAKYIRALPPPQPLVPVQVQAPPPPADFSSSSSSSSSSSAPAPPVYNPFQNMIPSSVMNQAFSNPTNVQNPFQPQKPVQYTDAEVQRLDDIMKGIEAEQQQQ